jgi:hypothetical protein
MPTFVDRMLLKHNPPEKKSEEVVREFLDYYRDLYEKALAAGRKRQLSFLSSTQSNLSKFKKRVKAEEAWKKGLHLSKEQAQQLAAEKAKNMRDHSIDMQPIQGVQTVLDSRMLLDSPNVLLRIIALACLTGRRLSEIVATAQFAAPKEEHRLPNYWSHVSGLLKQRDKIKTCDIPLFEQRSRVAAALASVRREVGKLVPEQVNQKIAKRVDRAMKSYCPHMGNIHAFRRFYVIMAHHYFNDRNCSIARVGADVLCHQDMNSAVLPYLSTQVVDMEGLPFE